MRYTRATLPCLTLKMKTMQSFQGFLLVRIFNVHGFLYLIITKFHILETFTTIGVNFTVLSGQICATCKFLNLANDAGCYGIITNKDVAFQATFTINSSSDLHTKCIVISSSGVYHLSVYDIDNSGDVSVFPAFTNHNISISGTGW